MKDVSATIRDYIRKYLVRGRSAALVDGAKLLEEGIIDSFGLQQLLTFVELEFGVIVDDEHLRPEHFASVDAIAALVHSLNERKQPV